MVRQRGAGGLVVLATAGALGAVLALGAWGRRRRNAFLLRETLADLLAGSSRVSHAVVFPVAASRRMELRCLASPELPPSLVVPGSFNPLHEGHEEMARQAANVLALDPDAVLFELCAVNADKGALSLDELLRRVQALAERGHRVLVTRASLFAEKAALCRGCGFAVGYDTYRRIVDPKYYAPPGVDAAAASQEERREWVLAALRPLRAAGIRVAVAGRLDAGGFRTLEEQPLLELPPGLEGLFVPIPGFRLDLSSTELRRRQAAADSAAAGS